MIKLCNKCDELFEYEEKDCIWDETGYGYSTKLVRCKECGCWNVIRVIKDVGFDVNGDDRFFEY